MYSPVDFLSFFLNPMTVLGINAKTEFTLVAQWYRTLLLMQEMQETSVGQEDLLEEEMATCSNIFVWKIPWTEEPGGL